MENLIALDLLSRWVHIGTAIVVLGGSVFMRFILMPAAAELPDAEHQALRERVMARWKKFVMIGIVLFLVSGFYNFLVVSLPKHKGDKLYAALIGTKILLALGVFILASALTGRAAAFDGIRKNSKRWLLILIVLAATIVVISGVLKIACPPTP